MNLHETAMGQRFFNVQLPTLINTLKDIAAALSRPAPSAISFPADQHFLTSLYYGEYEADVFKPDKRLAPFNQAVQQKEKALLPSPINASHLLTRQYNRKKKLCFRCSPARRPSLLNSIRLRYNAAILLYWSKHTPLATVLLCRCLRQA